jgi:hypothetical protein
MIDNKDLQESFDLVIKANKEKLDDDFFLVKARQAFEKKTGFKPNKRQLLAKSKTFTQFLAGVTPDEKLMKALQEGQTKVKNGITYVVKKTKTGKLDWRRATTKSKKAVQVDDDPDFPKDLDNLEVVKALGGSTGAKLVKDKDTGDLFVMKKGASQGHIEEEVLANRIYEELGVNVPLIKIYNEGTADATMLSSYMENTEVANNVLDDKLKSEIMSNFVADCLLANWDAYKNDNILVNKDDGLVYRVDNGGSLRYSAQGRDKAEDFTDEVDELDSMIAQNISLTAGLTFDDINTQIRDVLKREKAVLKLIKDKDLKVKMKKRFFDLETRVDDFDNANKDPYRELSEKDLKKAYKKANGDLRDVNLETGWTFLSEVCKMRGFDKPPEVIDSDKFDKLMAQKDTKLLQRGVTSSHGNTATKYMKQFAYDPKCFYGRVGIYGAGIYAAVNSTKKNPPPPNHDYDIAYGYADYKEENVMDIALTADAKVIDAYELDEMMNEEFFGDDFKEKKKEYDKLNKTYQEKEDYAQNIEKIIEDETRDEMGWNQRVLDAFNSRAEVVYADPEVHSFKKVANYYSVLSKKLGGTVTKIDEGNYEVSLPHSSESFILSDGISGRSLKQKNEYSKPYNLHYKYFKDFVIDNHYKKIDEKIKGIQKDDARIQQAHDDAKQAQADLKVIADEIQTLRVSGDTTMGEVLGEIAKRPSGEYRGFYAAIKGYDAVIQKNGWGGKTDFAVILNRSKMVVRKTNNF